MCSTGCFSESGDFTALFFLVRQYWVKLLNGLNWKWKNLNSFIYTLCSYVLKLNKWKHLLFMTFLKSPDSLMRSEYIVSLPQVLRGRSCGSIFCTRKSFFSNFRARTLGSLNFPFSKYGKWCGRDLKLITPFHLFLKLILLGIITVRVLEPLYCVQRQLCPFSYFS